MVNFSDGDLYQQDPFFQTNPNALWVNLYTDEFEVCNPIGAKKGKHKLMAVYYVIGNMHAKYRSQLRFTHLALLVKYKYVKNSAYDFSSILKPLIQDLQVLQTEGILIKRSHTIRGKLVSISAENLSAHAVAGFQQCFNSGRICRHCMIDYQELSEHINEDNLTMRSEDVHDYHLRAVYSNPINSAIYGVKKSCPFSVIPEFQVTTSFPPDIMHDLMEGCIPNTIQLVLQHFVKNRLITVGELNNSLRSLKISHMPNKPNEFTDASLRQKGHITGTTTQKFELFLCLPQIIADKIERNDPIWAVYLLLREVCDIVFARVVDRTTITYLQDKIGQYLRCFVDVFGKENMKPKHHYLVHYPRYLKMYGPLVNFWCMRFEGKHQYFKQVAKSTNSFINVAKTLAKRHQLRQCWEWSASELLNPTGRAISKTKQIKLTMLPEEVRNIIRHRLSLGDATVIIELNEMLASFTEISVANVLYKVNAVYVVELIEAENFPVFIHIRHILNVRHNWILCGMLMIPFSFDSHLHAYSFQYDKQWTVITPGQVIDHCRHDLFVIDAVEYVSMRHNVEC